MMVRPDWREPLAWLGGWVPSREHVDKGKFKKKKSLPQAVTTANVPLEKKNLIYGSFFIRKSGGESSISVSKNHNNRAEKSVVNKEPN